MDNATPHPRVRLDLELERALHDWMTASRRAFDPARDSSDLWAEHAAWGRVRSVLEARDSTPTAA